MQDMTLIIAPCSPWCPLPSSPTALGRPLPLPPITSCRLLTTRFDPEGVDVTEEKEGDGRRVSRLYHLHFGSWHATGSSLL